MFWRVSTYAQPTPVEAFLDKANTDLEELLQLDELLQVWVTPLLPFLGWFAPQYVL